MQLSKMTPPSWPAVALLLIGCGNSISITTTTADFQPALCAPNSRAECIYSTSSRSMSDGQSDKRNTPFCTASIYKSIRLDTAAPARWLDHCRNLLAEGLLALFPIGDGEASMHNGAGETDIMFGIQRYQQDRFNVLAVHPRLQSGARAYDGTSCAWAFLPEPLSSSALSEGSGEKDNENVLWLPRSTLRRMVQDAVWLVLQREKRDDETVATMGVEGVAECHTAPLMTAVDTEAVEQPEAETIRLRWRMAPWEDQGWGTNYVQLERVEEDLDAEMEL